MFIASKEGKPLEDGCRMVTIFAILLRAFLGRFVWIEADRKLRHVAY